MMCCRYSHWHGLTMNYAAHMQCGAVCVGFELIAWLHPFWTWHDLEIGFSDHHVMFIWIMFSFSFFLFLVFSSLHIWPTWLTWRVDFFFSCLGILPWALPVECLRSHTRAPIGTSTENIFCNSVISSFCIYILSLIMFSNRCNLCPVSGFNPSGFKFNIGRSKLDSACTSIIYVTAIGGVPELGAIHPNESVYWFCWLYSKSEWGETQQWCTKAEFIADCCGESKRERWGKISFSEWADCSCHWCHPEYWFGLYTFMVAEYSSSGVVYFSAFSLLQKENALWDHWFSC